MALIYSDLWTGMGLLPTWRWNFQVCIRRVLLRLTIAHLQVANAGDGLHVQWVAASVLNMQSWQPKGCGPTAWRLGGV